MTTSRLASYPYKITDRGIMLTGAFNAIRSSQAETQELLSILDNSRAQILVVEDLKTLNKLSPHLVSPLIGLIILLSDEQPELDLSIATINFTHQMLILAPLKIRRPVVMEWYHSLINEMFDGKASPLANRGAANR